jgi:phosphoribosylformylglycinamidine synthase
VRLKARIVITLKPGVLDPQGKAISQSLASLGFRGVKQVRLGRYIEIELSGNSKDELHQELEEMCRRLLANPVTEQYRFELEDRA